MGTGSIDRLLKRLHPSGSIIYKVLCGRNEKLFQFVKQLNHPYIKAIPYITKKEEMNVLYDKADAIITKPGGITITECLWKQVPIFVYEALPGPEEMNLKYLKKEQLIFYLNNWSASENVEQMIIEMLKDCSKLEKRCEKFRNCIIQINVTTIIKEIYKEKVNL